MTEATSLVKTLKRRVLAAANVVSEARLAVERGNFIDLSGLETETEAILKEISRIPAEDADEMKSALISLADDIDRLTKSVEAAHKQLATELSDLNARRRAAKAYFLGQRQE